MRCPHCNFSESSVVDTRVVDDETQIYRRRVCLNCQKRFTTYEVAREEPIYVVKKDNRREPFSRQKILEGIKIACKKRPISIETIEDIARFIEKECHNRLQKEIRTKEVGKLIMQKLEEIDAVAYVRFASVYKEFKDVSLFMKEIQKFQEQTKKSKKK